MGVIMSEECIFCKIASGQIPSEKVFENEHVVAFHDINPQAPTHVLIVPKDHVASLNEVSAENMDVVIKLFDAVKEVAKKTQIADEGYRVIVNTNRAAGQEVFHLHFHVMGGRTLGSMG
jgi:histidine triad (HIT) family protein